MSDRNPPGSVPPEYEHLMRPGSSTGSVNPGQTARHDLVSDTGLQNFEGYFRDAQTSPQQPVSMPPETSDAGATRILSRNPPPPPPPYRAGSQPPPPATPRPPLPPPGQVAPPVFPTDRPKKSGRVKKVLLIILVVLLAYAAGLATLFALSVNKINALPATQIADTAGDNYLMVGSDGRDQLTKQQIKRLGTGYVEGQRTDSIMILHVPLIGTPTLVSVPRDSWVPIPGHGSNKINAAYALGGAPLLVQTVENTTGLHIDHFVEIGMDGIANITDSLGGVTLCPKANYNDHNSRLHVKKGCQTMDGRTSLAYVRMRYADPTGDVGRAERQQEYMKSVAMKAVNPLTWLNPFKEVSFDRAAGSALTVDNDTGIVDDTRMSIAMGMISAGMGESTAVPAASDSYWVDGQQAVKWDTPKALELFRGLGGG